MSAPAGDLWRAAHGAARRWRGLCLGGAILAGSVAGHAAQGQTQAAPTSPAQWAKLLQDGSASDAASLAESAWPLVAYWITEGKAGRSELRTLRLTEAAWNEHGLTQAALDAPSFAYALRLNPLADTPTTDGGEALARKVMLLAGTRLALELGSGSGGEAQPWTLWGLSGETVAIVHRSSDATARERSLKGAAAFVREALGYDGIVVAADGDRLLARIAAKRTTALQAGMVLSASAAPLRIADERERDGTAIVRVTAVEGSWATLKLVAAPRLPTFAVGSKLILDTARQR